MKNTYILALTALCFGAAAFATTTKDVYGGGSRTKFPAGDYAVVLHANTTTPTEAKFDGGGATVRSIITYADDNPTLWNIAYGAYIDTQQSTGMFTAFQNTGIMDWRIGGVEIKNTTAGDSVADVKIGTLSLVVNDISKESAWLKLSTNANVSGEALNLNSSTSFRVSNNSTVNYSVTKTNINNNSSFVIDSGSTLITSSGLSYGSSGKFIIAGTYKFTGTNLYLGGNTELTGSAEALSTSKTFIVGKVNFAANSTYTARGAIQVSKSGTITVADTSKVILSDEDSVYVGRIIMNGGTLNLDGINVFSRDSVATPLSNLVVLDTDSVVNVNAANKFQNLHFSAGSGLTINLSDDASDILYFYTVSGFPTNSSLVINDFSDSRIFFVSKGLFYNINATINAVDGKTYSASDMDFIAGNYEGTAGYWLNVAVPEPSTYAAIFGALALGLALYRRRR